MRPAPPAHPRRGPIGREWGRDHGSSAPVAGPRAGGRTARGDVGAGRASPAPFPGGGAGARRPAPPRPEWAGRLGLRSWAGGGPPPASPKPGERPALQPPTQQRSQLAEPRDTRVPGRPGRARREGARGGAGQASRAPGRPPPAGGPAQRSPGTGSAGRARARAMPR